MSGCRKSFRILPVPREKYLLKSASYFATSRMSSKKTSILLCLLVALSFAVVSVFIQTGGQAAVAQSGPLPQSSEAFGLAGGCYVGGQFIPYEGTCGDQTQPTECAYSQEICKPVGGTGECKPARHDTLFGTVCKQGLGCKAASTCDGKGTCIEGKVVDCSLQDTECERWGCANAPGGTCEVIQRIDKVDAVCLKTTDPIVCGQRYWERYSVTSPAKCGGKKECPANTQLDGPACPECSCGYALPPNLDWCGGRRGWCTNGTDLCKSYCDTIGAGTSSYSNDSGACTCSGVPNLQVCPTSLSVSWSAEKYQWVESLTTPASCRPSTPPSKIATSCSWASLGTQTIGFTLTQSHFSATVSGGIPGTFSYNHSAGEMLPLGDTLMTATFTPNDQTLYSGTTCSSTVTIVPKKTTCAVSASNGTAGTKALGLVSAVAYDAQFAFITVKGTFTYTIDGQTPSASLVLDAGKTYPVVAKFEPSEWGYEGTSCQGSITIDAQSAICTVDSASRPYNTTLSKALGFVCKVGSVAITTVISGGVVAAPPAQDALPGDYPVGFSSAPTSTNYSIKTMPGTVTVTPVDSSCRLTGLTGQSVEFGTAIGFGAQGYIAGTTTPIGGTFTLNEGATSVADGDTLAVGTHTITGSFAPSSAGYKPSTCNGSVTVTPQSQKATRCVLAVSNVSYGTPTAFSGKGYDSTTSAVVDGIFTYTIDGNTVTPGVMLDWRIVGRFDAPNYRVIATFAPSSSAYAGSTCDNAFWVYKQTATCYADSATRDYNTELVQPLGFVCRDSGGTVIPRDIVSGVLTAPPAKDAPPQDYAINFLHNPTSNNYSFDTVSGKVTVNQVDSSCKLTGLTGQTIAFGTPINFGAQGYIGTSSSTLSGGYVFKEGTATVSDPATLAAGSHTITASFTPSNGGYRTSTCSGSVTVAAGCTSNSECTVDDGNACTANTCCLLTNGCAVGSTTIPKGQCYNKTITTPIGSISPTMELICPANGASTGQIKLTWTDNATCTNSSYSYSILASTSAFPAFTPTPGPSDALSTTDTRSACSGTSCSVTRTSAATNFKSGKTIYASVAILSTGMYYQQGSTFKLAKCAWCGDATISGTEQCDGTVLPAGKTAAQGHRCNACTLEWCGDGIINGGEQCDGTVLPADKTAAQGYRCNACKLEWCGDGITNGTEQCDGGSSCSEDCRIATVQPTASSCQISPTTINYGTGAAFNGVGKVSGTATILNGVWAYTVTAGGVSKTAKEGDILDANTYSVSATFAPYDTAYTTSTCTGTFTVNAVCGDDVIAGTEQCDGTTLPVGTAAGSTCTTTCEVDTPPSTICRDQYSGNQGYYFYSARSDPGTDPNNACTQAEAKLSGILGGLNMTGLTLVREPSDKVYSVGSSGKLNIVSMECVASACVYASTTTGGGGGADQCPAIPDSCGSGCRSAPYPTCVVCDQPCPNNPPIMYYTADGQCLMATSWGPSPYCCPSVGCDIQAHGYGDQQDQSTGEWYKMVDITSACPSQRGKLLGDPVPCPTCKCTSKLDCINNSDPSYFKEIVGGYSPQYGHEVIRDDYGARVAVGDDKCWCVPDPNACPSGYRPLQAFNLEIEYTPIEQTGMLDGSSCKSAGLP